MGLGFVKCLSLEIFDFRFKAMGGSKIQATVENGDAPTRLYISRRNFPKARPPAAGTWAAGRWAALARPRTVEK